MVEDRFGMTWQLFNSRAKLQKVVPTLCSWIESRKAEEAMNFYTSIFPDSSVKKIRRYPDEEREEKPGSIEHGQFWLNNYLVMIKDSAQPFSFNFNEGVSLVVECNTQEEIDNYWERLTAEGGEEGMCGWLKDKYGVSWQIVPATIDDEAFRRGWR